MGSSPVDAARTLAPQVRAAADRIEQGRRLPSELVAALASAGLFRMCVPRSLGGGEVDPVTMVRTIEAVAEADASAGWCVMIAATTGLTAAYLPDEVAREVYGREPTTVTGGVFAPSGRATRVDGGYRLSGRWAFASGCEHCEWLLGGCLIDADPEPRMLVFPARAARVIDTWSVSGLRGTGSHDIAVEELFVPAGWVASVVGGRPRETGPLYAFPLFGLLALGIAAVALGVARTAITTLGELAGTKTPTLTRRLLRDRGAVQIEVAQAEAALRAARAFVLDAVSEAWQTARSGGPIPIPQRTALRLAATYATVGAAGVVDRMYTTGGGTSVYASSPLQRCFRDVHVVTQHTMVAPATWELAGRLLLGVETDTAML